MTSQQNPPVEPTPVPVAPAPAETKKKSEWNIRIIASGGIFTALVLIATYFLRVPLPVVGYIHLGDGVIFIAAMILGPFAAVPAALGSALADLAAGVPIYIPATILIKGFMGAFAGIMLNKKTHWKHILPQVIVLAVAEIAMVGGYFAYESALYGLAIATGSIIYNAVQAIAGVAIGTACIPAMLRFRKNAQIPASPEA